MTFHRDSISWSQTGEIRFTKGETNTIAIVGKEKGKGRKEGGEKRGRKNSRGLKG